MNHKISMAMMGLFLFFIDASMFGEEAELAEYQRHVFSVMSTIKSAESQWKKNHYNAANRLVLVEDRILYMDQERWRLETKYLRPIKGNEKEMEVVDKGLMIYDGIKTANFDLRKKIVKIQNGDHRDISSLQNPLFIAFYPQLVPTSSAKGSRKFMVLSDFHRNISNSSSTVTSIWGHDDVRIKDNDISVERTTAGDEKGTRNYCKYNILNISRFGLPGEYNFDAQHYHQIFGQEGLMTVVDTVKIKTDKIKIGDSDFIIAKELQITPNFIVKNEYDEGVTKTHFVDLKINEIIPDELFQVDVSIVDTVYDIDTKEFIKNL